MAQKVNTWPLHKKLYAENLWKDFQWPKYESLDLPSSGSCKGKTRIQFEFNNVMWILIAFGAEFSDFMLPTL